MRAEKILKEKVLAGLNVLYGIVFPENQVTFQKTRKEFKGEFTLVTFPFIKTSKKSPEQTGEEIGNWMKENSGVVSAFNVVKGFLNLELTNDWWMNYFSVVLNNKNFGIKEVTADSKSVM